MAQSMSSSDSSVTLLDPNRLEQRTRLLLRPGRGSPVFLLAGGGGDLHELEPLVAMLQTRRPLLGVPYWEAAECGTLPASVEAIADVAVKTVRSWQPNGPYTLVGYSLGGLGAAEVPRRLIAQGHSVKPPILIDALTHKSAWSLPIFVRTSIRYVLYRTRLRRDVAATATAAHGSDEPDEVADRCREARDRYRPMRYNGRVTLLHAVRVPYIGGLAPAIWRTLALAVDSFPMAARHLDLLRVHSVVATVAR